MKKKEEILGARLGMSEVNNLALTVDVEELFQLLFHPDKRVSDNAAWAMTHFPPEKMQALCHYQQELIDEAMKTDSVTKRRLIMTLLEKQPFHEEDIRTDFLDFCLAQIGDPNVPVGIRSLAVKLSYAQCRFYPELLAELRAVLEMMGQEPLSPGARSIRKRVLKEISKACS